MFRPHSMGISKANYKVADSLYIEARKTIQELQQNYSPEYAEIINNLAELYQSMGKYSEAEELYKEVVNLKFKEITQNFKNLSENEKEKYIQANVEKYFNDFQKFVLKRYTQNPEINTYSYDLVLQTKGLILNSTEKVKNRILQKIIF